MGRKLSENLQRLLYLINTNYTNKIIDTVNNTILCIYLPTPIPPFFSLLEKQGHKKAEKLLVIEQK